MDDVHRLPDFLRVDTLTFNSVLNLKLLHLEPLASAELSSFEPSFVVFNSHFASFGKKRPQRAWLTLVWREARLSFSRMCLKGDNERCST